MLKLNHISKKYINRNHIEMLVIFMPVPSNIRNVRSIIQDGGHTLLISYNWSVETDDVEGLFEQTSSTFEN